jgi:xylitol oxidase
MPEASAPLTNWGGTYEYRARRVHHPRSVDELQQLVTASTSLRPLGTRHSFSGVGDGAELCSTLDLPEVLEVDSSGGLVRVGAGMTYARLGDLLAPHGLALANLPSLPHVCVGGAVATGTHGSGLRLGSMAAQVAGLRLVVASGDLVEVPEVHLDGHVVSLGALGVVTELDLRVEPAYEVTQRVYDGGPPAALGSDLPGLMALGDSVSVFTDWVARTRVVVKSRVPTAERVPPDLRPLDHQVSVLPDGDPAAMTAQLGAPGRWDERMTHFRADAVPSAGRELQSEYLLPVDRFADAVPLLVELGPRLGGVLAVSEVRTVAADHLWLSGAFGGDRVAVHLTWQPEPAEVDARCRDLEAALLPLGARPHWGKHVVAGVDELAPAYPRLSDFVRLAGELDPRGTFTNAYLREKLGLG